MKTINLKSAALLASLFAAMALTAPGAHAGTATGTLPVSANVAANCSLTTTPVAFGAYDPIGTGTVKGTGTLVVTCVKGTTVSNITLSAGGSSGAAAPYARSMTTGAPGSDKLGYDLFLPASPTPSAACAYTTKWDASNGIFAPGLVTSNTANTYNVCGQMTNGQNVGTGSYTDSVGVTVNF